MLLIQSMLVLLTGSTLAKNDAGFGMWFLFVAALLLSFIMSFAA